MNGSYSWSDLPPEESDDEVAERLRPLLSARRPGFDFEAYHRSHFSRRIRCPHCDSARVHSWGSFGQRRRFRCVDGCGRTFSTFTGTPLAYVKRIDLFPAYLECVRARRSTRRTAGLIGCHRDTAFRWRHRLLAAWVAADRTTLSGRVALGQTWFAHSRKGERGLERPGRRRGSERELVYRLVPRVWVLLARELPTERSGIPRPGLLATNVGVRNAPLRHYGPALLARLRRPTALVCTRGPLSPEARLARMVGAAYERHPERGQVWVPEIWKMRRELVHWLRPFRGVATRYLEHYLRWFAVGERLLDHPIAFRWLPALCTNGATARSDSARNRDDECEGEDEGDGDQQFLQTERYARAGGGERVDGAEGVGKTTPTRSFPRPLPTSPVRHPRGPPVG